MSTENVRKFYERLKGNKSLVEAFRKTMEGAKSNSEGEAFDVVVKFAEREGFTFSAAELKTFEAEAKELSPEELSNISAAYIHERTKIHCRIISQPAQNQ